MDDILEKLVNWVTNNALFTGVFAAIFTLALQRIIDFKKDKANRESKRNDYVKYLSEEFEYNKYLLSTLKTYIGGPLIEDIEKPLASGAKHLRTDAWDAIVREGTYADLSIPEQRQYRIANRSIRDVAFQIEVLSANYSRVKNFRKLEDEINQPSTNPSNFHDQAMEMIKERIDYAIEMINDSLILAS